MRSSRTIWNDDFLGDPSEYLLRHDVFENVLKNIAEKWYG